MKDDSSNQQSDSELRKRAEAILKGRRVEMGTLSPEDVKRLVHELRVHQIELEMQNEELRHAQLELQTTQNRYAHLYDFAPTGYITLDSEDLILEVNLTVTEMLGTERNNLIEQRLSHFVFPEDQDTFYLYRRKLVESGEAQRCEVRLVKVDGSPFYAQLIGTAVRDDNDGQVNQSRVSVLDITERKHAEETLQASEVRYRRLFEAAKDGILILDPETGQIVDVNPFLIDLLGYSYQEFLGKKLWEIGAFRNIVASQAAFAELRKESYVRYEDLPLETQAGKLIEVEFVSNIYEAGHKAVIQCNIRDITERKRTERATYLMSDTQRQIAQLDDLMGIYQLVGEKVQELIEDGYVVISMLDEQAQAMKVVGLYGFGDLYQELVRRFKLDPARFTYSLADMTDDELRLFRSGRLENFEGGVYALLSRKVPKSVCDVVEKQLNVSSIYTMGFVWQGVHFGGLTLLAKRDVAPYRDMIEIIMNQATISINRIRAEEALRKSEAQYRDLVRYMGSGVVVYEAVDNGRNFIIKTVNPAGAKISQVQVPDIIAKSILEVFPGVEDFGLFAALQQVWMTGEPAHLPAALYSDDHISQWVENYLYKLPSGEVVAVYDDVSKRIEAEEALVHERDLLHALMDNIPDSIYFKDAQSRFTRVNRAMARKHGLENTEQAVGTTDFDYFTREIAQTYFEGEQAVIRTGQPEVNVEEEEVWPDRPATWASTTTVPLRDGADNIVGLIGVARDITERKQAERALQRYADRLTILREIDLAILSSRSPEEIARRALTLLDKLIPCNHASLTLFDFAAGKVTRLAAQAANQGALRAGLQFPLEHFVTDWERLRQNTICVRDDIQEDPEDSPVLAAMKAEGICTLLNVPLVFQSELIGSLNLAKDTPGAFAGEDLEIAQEVTGQLAIAIQQARLDETEREQRALAEALRDTARIVASSLDLDKVLKDILDSVDRVVPHDAAEVWLIEGDQARVVGSAGYTERASEEALRALRLNVADTRNMREALQSGKPVVISDTHAYDGWVSSLATNWVRSTITVPVRVRDDTLGFLNLVDAAPDCFTASAAGRLQAFADQVSTAIQNAQLYQELETYSSILEQAVEARTAELKQKKEQAEAILQSAADAMAISDSEGVFLAVNPAFVRQTGYAVDEAVGQHIRLISGESPDNLSIREVVGAAQSARPWRMETPITRKDGSQFDADVSMAPLNQGEEGEVQGFVIALHDVSLFKEVERMKDDFLSTAAHELRTPLTSIRGFSEILLTRDLPEDRQNSYMQTINEQSTQLAQIIDDLLDISRLEAGRGLDLKPEPVDMGILVAEAVQPFVDISPNHHFTLEGLADSPPVQGDPFRLGQVLRNLLSNAVKYSPDGGPVIVRVDVDTRYLAISVQDEGIGMTPKQQSHLFERFYRADATTSQSIGGTGLGLTICKLIVEGHGGQMRVASEPDAGSTFTFTVPLAGVEGGTKGGANRCDG